MAGRDATRSFGKFSTDESLFKDEYDDCADLSEQEWSAVKEWENQFKEKWVFHWLWYL